MDDERETRADIELLAAAARDPAAFARFYRRHVHAVIAFFHRRTGDAELAADLTAETFAAALEGCRRYAPRLRRPPRGAARGRSPAPRPPAARARGSCGSRRSLSWAPTCARSPAEGPTSSWWSAPTTSGAIPETRKTGREPPARNRSQFR
jgi:Sigma-70 region 2